MKTMISYLLFFLQWLLSQENLTVLLWTSIFKITYCGSFSCVLVSHEYLENYNVLYRYCLKVKLALGIVELVYEHNFNLKQYKILCEGFSCRFQTKSAIKTLEIQKMGHCLIHIHSTPKRPFLLISKHYFVKG